MKPMFVDFFGNLIKIGHMVAFYAPGYRQFCLGTVIAFTAKQVRVEYKNDWNYGPEGRLMQYLGYPSMFIVKPVEETPLRIY